MHTQYVPEYMTKAHEKEKKMLWFWEKAFPSCHFSDSMHLKTFCYRLFQFIDVFFKWYISINKSRDMEVIKVTVTRNRVKNDSLRKERVKPSDNGPWNVTNTPSQEMQIPGRPQGNNADWASAEGGESGTGVERGAGALVPPRAGARGRPLHVANGSGAQKGGLVSDLGYDSGTSHLPASSAFGSGSAHGNPKPGGLQRKRDTGWQRRTARPGPQRTRLQAWGPVIKLTASLSAHCYFSHARPLSSQAISMAS